MSSQLNVYYLYNKYAELELVSNQLKGYFYFNIASI